jgi:hypothetical protein
MDLSNSTLPRTQATSGVKSPLAAPGNTIDDRQAQPLHTGEGPAKWWTLSWPVYTLILLLLPLPLILLRVVLIGTEGPALPWLLNIPQPAPTTTDVAGALAPLLAVSVAIERLLETVFNWYEQSVSATAKVIKQADTAVGWAQVEYRRAYMAVEAAVFSSPLDSSTDLLNQAEARLAAAEQRLNSWITGSEYVAFKTAICIAVGLLVGLAVAILGDLKMLHMVGLPVARLLDVLLTGLIIGMGPGPLHSLIGILQAGKDALAALAVTGKQGPVNIRDTLDNLRIAVVAAGDTAVSGSTK